MPKMTGSVNQHGPEHILHILFFLHSLLHMYIFHVLEMLVEMFMLVTRKPIHNHGVKYCNTLKYRFVFLS